QAKVRRPRHGSADRGSLGLATWNPVRPGNRRAGKPLPRAGQRGGGMRNARDVRALIERRRAERGAVLTDQEWERIARIVDAAAPIPDDAFHHLTSLLRPLLPLAAPLAEPP